MTNNCIFYRKTSALLKKSFGIHLGISCIMLLFLCACYSPTQNEKVVMKKNLSSCDEDSNEFDKLDESKALTATRLYTTIDIKMFIYNDIIHHKHDKDYEEKYRIKEYRFMWEPDFDYIAKELRTKYPELKFVSGRHGLIDDCNTNAGNGRIVDDGLDYSIAHVYKNNVECWQLGKIQMSDDGQKIKINVIRYRAGLDGSGEYFIFRKKDNYWYFCRRVFLWIS